MSSFFSPDLCKRVVLVFGLLLLLFEPFGPWMVVTLPVINVGTAVDGSSPKTKAQWSGKIVNKQLMKSKQCGKMRNLLILEKYFVKTTSLGPFGNVLISRNFCKKKISSDHCVLNLLREKMVKPPEIFSHAQTCHFAVKLQTRKNLCVCTNMWGIVLTLHFSKNMSALCWMGKIGSH